ncbi:hypothetical protein Thein_0452 [Thermodesulfatator indicus DSM 15286]|uniref:Uncharacterized protein n=1 Tax=Thermodesulfatator indicus (strain DSM 15286 / JCM 11887 / CIR29812) TaxID=667014 RepID=F8A865_THEID|nr:hypothetical protein [Thermodesulfatator indicus]AEH44334.1 hypothetical protein Thein_0452 [Thermodesulfatator indicus DSM 15286]
MKNFKDVQNLEAFISFQKEEASFLERLLGQRQFSTKDLEALNAFLYERRKYSAILRNLPWQREFIDYLEVILKQEEKSRELLLALRDKISSYIKEFSQKSKAFKNYSSFQI